MLIRGGHEVVTASRRSGVDVATGYGMPAALKGASVVVDVTDSPCLEDGEVMRFFTEGTRRLLPLEAEAGVEHHVMLSVVGTGPRSRQRLLPGEVGAGAAD